jgi:hypothetical protein
VESSEVRARALVVIAFASAAAVAPIACVDLFHSTDFETARDAGPPDVVTPDAPPDVGPEPLVDFCKWDPATAKTNATRACAWMSACGGALGETIFGLCMMHALWAYDCDLNPNLRPNGATYALWSCLSKVKTCGDVEACITAGAPQTCKPVAGSFTQCGLGNETVGSVRVECSSPQGGAASGLEPCLMQGRTCFAPDTSSSMCAGVTKKSCSSGLSCGGPNGTAAVDCRVLGSSTLVDFGLDCAAFGAGECVTDTAGDTVVGCAPSGGEACDGGIALTCSDAGVHSCVSGKDIAIDCAKLGVGCDATKAAAYEPLRACVKQADAGGCNSADSCEQGKLRSCAQGIAFEADCTALGLGPCEQINNGVLAHCKAP